jgi:hypothetical protein
MTASFTGSAIGVGTSLFSFITMSSSLSSLLLLYHFVSAFFSGYFSVNADLPVNSLYFAPFSYFSKINVPDFLAGNTCFLFKSTDIFFG